MRHILKIIQTKVYITNGELFGRQYIIGARVFDTTGALSYN
jgi:hypothetical protein